MKIYVAGPYSKGNILANVRRAIRMGDAIAEMGHTPYIPHLTYLWDKICPHEYAFWLAYDMQWLKLCDALFRVSGESPGADKEVERAKELGMPVYYTLEELRSL